MTVRGGPTSYSFEVKGATQIDVDAMKSLHERGAIFIDVGYTDSWVEEHIPGSVNLTGDRSNNPSNTRLERKTLIAIAQKGDEVVIYCTGSGCSTGAYAAAMTANWGYDKVYYFTTGDGVQAWKDAGYPVETKPVQ
jgi:rhodanese-related sulfurtransferase